MVYDLSADSGCDNYDLLTQAVLPRPIAWILSENVDGSLNLAPFSYFNLVASRPALFSVSIGLRSDTSPKDTRRNLVEGRSCVIHVPNRSQIDEVNQSATALPTGESEITVLGLETAPFGDFALPRLAGAPAAFGGKLHREVSFEGVPQSLLIIEAQCAFIADRVISAEPGVGASELDPLALDPLARLGRTAYAGLGEILERSRPG